jgi:hypothetical protein
MRIYSNKPISWQKLLHVRSAIHMGIQLFPYDMFTLYKSRRIDALIEPVGSSNQQTLYKPRDFITYQNYERMVVFDSSKDNNYKAINILGETIYVPHTFENGDKIIIENENDIALTTRDDNNNKYNSKSSVDEYLHAYLI